MSTSAPTPRRSVGRRILVWTARGLGVLVALLVVGVGAVYGVSSSRMSRSYEVRGHAIPVSSDSATLARGKHVAVTRGCTECHGDNMAGHVMIDDPAFGRLATANLTAGRPGGLMTPEAFELAVRHGVRSDGRSVLLMPSQEFKEISDEDMGALYSYLRTLPAVSASLPAPSIGPVARALSIAGAFELTPARIIAQAAPHQPAPPVGATPEYGRYLAVTCTGCHKPDFTGGPMPGSPPSAPPVANLTPDQEDGIGAWSEDHFVTALTTGQRPDGPPINGEFMPIKMTKQLSDTEKRAIYRYLRTVEAKKSAKK
jgi:mono/diheme cytochrome c family protein